MSTVIKDGTIVTADRTYKADVLVENGKITKIGEGLSANETLDATGCYVMPGGIDPHTHLEMPFMGTYSTDDFESGTRAALSGGTTMVVDFCLPAPDQSLLTAIQAWDNKSRAPPPTIPSIWRSPGGASRSSTKCRKSSPRGSTPSSISWPTRAR
ncbi:MAG: hypothetical protein CM15mP60_0850 [Alphaproteobacteria bacterium]|nr:MAG: hypothetical protein CM15mP60_0850 [Alphaproteobacteria bacterium]